MKKNQNLTQVDIKTKYKKENTKKGLTNKCCKVKEKMRIN